MDVEKFKSSARAFFKNRLVRTGGPFFTFMLIGVFGLKQFTSIRYEFSSSSQVVREKIEKSGVDIKKVGEVTLETEYDKIKELDIENWKPIRIPRPWEENVN